MEQIILVVHLVIALAIIGLIMLQQGKGADVGASFGAGASQTLFGSTGTTNVLTKSTAWLVAAFFATSFGLAVFADNKTANIDDLGFEIPVERSLDLGGAEQQGEAKPILAEDAYYVLEAASSVVFVPGYGMAVAQAQHAVRELGDILEENGCEVKYAVHPVAGRMPGHMNVLLAEAEIDYEQLIEMDEVNPTFAQTDVAIVLGANDVVNPLAKTDPDSPIAGMPILDVDKAQTVVVIKRSLSPGFAGIPNPLFAADNAIMLFGDGKKAITDITKALGE